MNRIKCLAVIAMICLFSNISFGQAVINGNPISQKWMQIETDTLRVIFPEYMSAKAQRVSDYVHHLAANNTESLGGKIRIISIRNGSRIHSTTKRLLVFPCLSKNNFKICLDLEI
ncbi:MAG: hypothetical protein HRT66_01360 [Flavobacteriaceae bacterium]|nr:hypothetical protein [Flavobacteriaceae bacterium]